MPRNGWLKRTALGVLAVHAVACSDGGRGTELPPVHAASDERCGGDAWAASRLWPRLVPGTEGLDSPCIDRTFRGAHGRIAFDVLVDATGTVEDLRLPAGLSPAKESCIRSVAGGYVFLPARNCNGEGQASTYRAAFEIHSMPGAH